MSPPSSSSTLPGILQAPVHEANTVATLVSRLTRPFRFLPTRGSHAPLLEQGRQVIGDDYGSWCLAFALPWGIKTLPLPFPPPFFFLSSPRSAHRSTVPTDPLGAYTSSQRPFDCTTHSHTTSTTTAAAAALGPSKQPPALTTPSSSQQLL
ncbi:hypothetical protein BCV69DRAFT_41694 [Microstroma glucosiphilum]|uniref:Uncharacterized protein n=1 Tax=Pseudomicrostroma glucosiphilum TaxID=1684307 RepID=A0A316U4V0_9BASI|nr:hypothetical protein BCV69DRAFT_41694 [Pseudomicrostroma glucosiphilum]PWN19501.1 hypothetical protein BCV69DRAFT_41694 [Pseudomicrostroma glucosiphilum]